MASVNASTSSLGPQRGLGFCWIIYGLARVLLVLWLLAFQITATLMFGALLSRVPNPFHLMDGFHMFYAGVILLSIVCGVLGIFAGIALLANWGVGRTLALWAAFLSLSEMPLGLMLGVYTIVKLLPRFNERSLEA